MTKEAAEAIASIDLVFRVLGALLFCVSGLLTGVVLHHAASDDVSGVVTASIGLPLAAGLLVMSIDMTTSILSRRLASRRCSGHNSTMGVRQVSDGSRILVIDVARGSVTCR